MQSSMGVVKMSIRWLGLAARRIAFVGLAGLVFLQSLPISGQYSTAPAPLTIQGNLGGRGLTASQDYIAPRRSRSNQADARPSPRPKGPRAKPLKNSTPLDAGLGSGAYVGRVGGVAFDRTALPSRNLDIRSIELHYAAENADGQRCSVLVNGRPYKMALPTWQLVPITRYADSPYFAATTLFGELQNGQPKPASIEYVVSFHPDLNETILGLRLFQADFMLLDLPAAGDLPRFMGRPVLGAGESLPDPRVWPQAALKINNLFQSTRTDFTSYVICDHDQKIEFRLSGGAIELSGLPYFYFWKRGQKRIERVVEPRNQPQLVQSFEVIALKELSDLVSSRQALLMQLNPAVYRNLVNTMRYAAFFRFCKRKNLPGWRQFLASLERVDPVEYQAPAPVFLQKRTKPAVIPVRS